VATNANFTGGPFTCVDPWQGAASGGQSFDYPVSGYGPDRGRIRAVFAVPPGTGTPVNNASELYLCRVVFSHSKSTGIGACAGCLNGACIVLQSVKLLGPSGVPSYVNSNPILRQHVLWQAGGGVAGGCPGGTPTRAETWGSIKTLYR
jgi:hypothetical protein